MVTITETTFFTLVFIFSFILKGENILSYYKKMCKYICLHMCCLCMATYICSPQSFIIIVCGIISRMFQVAVGRGAQCCWCSWKQTRNICYPLGPGSSGAIHLTDTLATFQVHTHTLASALFPSSHLILRFSLLCSLPSFTETCPISLHVI